MKIPSSSVSLDENALAKYDLICDLFGYQWKMTSKFLFVLMMYGRELAVNMDCVPNFVANVEGDMFPDDMPNAEAIELLPRAFIMPPPDAPI